MRQSFVVLLSSILIPATLVEAQGVIRKTLIQGRVEYRGRSDSGVHYRLVHLFHQGTIFALDRTIRTKASATLYVLSLRSQGDRSQEKLSSLSDHHLVSSLSFTAAAGGKPKIQVAPS